MLCKSDIRALRQFVRLFALFSNKSTSQEPCQVSRLNELVNAGLQKLSKLGLQAFFSSSYFSSSKILKL